MHALPLGWATHLAVLEHEGALLDRRGDLVVVRSPANPTFHWGNALVAADPAAADDPAGLLAAFAQAHPEAGWVAIGLVREPADPAAWAAGGIELCTNDVLATATLPRAVEAPAGYVVRQLEGADWAQLAAVEIAANLRTGEHPPALHETFVHARGATQRALCARGDAAFLGAFADGALVSSLGVVRCGATARYQDVGTDEAHRRRGLAGHLLGVAARWAAARGCTRWVIVTEADNPAGRLYRSVGFTLDAPIVEAYRSPAG